MDEIDNILNDNSPSENPVDTEDAEQPKEKDFEEKESDSNKLEVEDQENENSSDRQVDDDAQVPQEDEEQETDKKDDADDQEAQNAQDDEEKEASEGETKKERRKRRKEKKSKRDKKDKKDKKKKKKSKDDDEKFKIFGDSDEEEDDSKDKDADFDTADVDIEEEEGKRTLEEILEKKKEKKKKRSRDDKKKSRSSKKKKSEDDDADSAVTEQTLPPLNEPNDFDLVIESLKKGHRRRKSDGPPEGSDEFVRGFVTQMDIAAEDDIRANQQHLPALNKVKLLPEVSTQLAKKFLHEIFVSAGVLTTLKKWLDPLPDGSLPNIKLREVVLRGLIDMGHHVQTEDLRESGIGRAIMLLSKHPQETLANKKSAKTLIELWSRPIFNLSSKYKDLYRAEERFPIAESEPTTTKSVKTTSHDIEHTVSGSPSLKSSKDNPTLHAKIPDKIALDFKVMPRENEEAKRLLGMPKRGGDSKGLARKSPGNKKVERAVTLSIEGRGVYH